jgi:hypothetical protein
MLIIDNCGSRLIRHHGNQSIIHSEIEEKNKLFDLFSLALDSSSSSISKSKSTWTATLGLVVHAAADGIALGNRRLNLKNKKDHSSGKRSFV